MNSISRILLTISIQAFLLMPIGLNAQGKSKKDAKKEKTKAVQGLDTLEKVVGGVEDFLLHRFQDTNYISNYGNEFALRLIGMHRMNYFRLWDNGMESAVRYRPPRDIQLGVGITHRYFSLVLAMRLGLFKIPELEDPEAIDIRFQLFSNKHYLTGTLQNYRGYELVEDQGLQQELSDASRFRSDIRTINFMLQYLYAFNYTKYSLRSSFNFNEIQRKSAGSVVAGANFSIFIMDADSSVIPDEIKPSFNDELYLLDLNIITIGITAGYMYTFVVKQHFFLTIGLIPGLNVSKGDYLSENQYRKDIPINVRFRVVSLNSVGYNGRRFFAGAKFMFDSDLFKTVKNLNVEVGHVLFSVFAGYRFGKK